MWEAEDHPELAVTTGWWRMAALGVRGSYWTQGGDCRGNVMLVSLAQGNPGPPFRRMQVTVLVFGLEEQLWLCFTPRPTVS